MERGFVPVIIILAVLVILGATGSFIVVSQLQKQEKNARPAREDTTPVSKIPGASPAPRSAIFPEPSPPPHEVAAPKPGIEKQMQKPLVETQAPAPGMTPPALFLPVQTSSRLAGLEREITVLYEGGNPIGPDHYARLNGGLDTEVLADADPTLIGKLRGMLQSINPDAVSSTASPQEQSQSPSACANNTQPVLTSDFTDFSKIKKITAPGSPSSEGPKGHSFVWTERERVPVYAPIAMTLDSGAYVKDTAESPAQYLLFFIVKNNCNYQVKFDHIDEPIPSIREQFPNTPAVADSRGKSVSQKIQFQSGDLIGYTAGNLQSGNWDFGLYNVKEKGVLATQYNSYGIHGYAVCWVNFYSTEKQAQYRRLLEGPKLLCSF